MPSKSQPHTAMRPEILFRVMRRDLPGRDAAAYAGCRPRRHPIATICAIEAARSDKLRRHAEGRSAWDGAQKGDEAAPVLCAGGTSPRSCRGCAQSRRPEIAKTIGVSRVYARDLARGKVPHPRHFAALAAMVGVAAPKETAAPDRWIAPV